MYKPNSFVVAAISAVLVFMGGFFYSPVAVSQEAEEEALEEVIVTASRREEDLQDVAMSVGVLDVQKFADAGLTGLPSILPFVPGVAVGDSGGPFFNSVAVRGINSTASAGVISYVDDIPFGSSTIYTAPAPLDGTLLDLGTLDVLKGPQGTLYGASALGGLLIFNTREASLTDWTGSISADLSDTHGGGFNQLYRVNANGPLATDSVGLSFTAFWKDKTGYIDNVNIPVEGWDDNEYYGGSGSLRWAATDRLEFNVQGLYQKSEQDGLATIEAFPAPAVPPYVPQKPDGEPVYGEYETGQPDVNPSEYEASLIGLTIDYQFDFGTLTSVTSTQEMTFIQSLDVTVPYAFLADLFLGDPIGTHTSAILVGDLGFEKFTQELRLTSESNQNFEWIIGGYYTDEDGHNIQRVDLAPPDDFYAANFPSTYEELSFFATGTYYFTPDFDGSFGIRYADYSNDVKLDVDSVLPLQSIPLTEIDDKVTNYLFNLRYRAGENMSFYGRIASGYRPGGANFTVLDGSGQPLTDPFFKPDSLWSYEIGMKGTSADGRFGYDVGAYYIDWQDYIIIVERGGVNVAANADKATSRGAEASLSFAATDALTITGTLSYINAELGADEPELGGRNGDQLPGSPEWQGVLDFSYDFALGDRPAYVGAAWLYAGERTTGFEGYTEDGVSYPSSNPLVNLDSYNLVDLRAGVKVGPFDFSLYVLNLFDEWAYTSFASSSLTRALGTPTRPRTIGGVVRWNFF